MNDRNEQYISGDTVLAEKFAHFFLASREEAEQILETQPGDMLSSELLELVRSRLALLERAYQQKAQEEFTRQSVVEAQFHSQPLEEETNVYESPSEFLEPQPAVTSVEDRPEEIIDGPFADEPAAMKEAEGVFNQPPPFLDDQGMGDVLRQMSPAHWQQLISEIRHIAPENLAEMTNLLQAQMGLSSQQAAGVFQGVATFKQFDEDQLQQATEQIAQFPPETIEQLGHLATLSFNTQNMLGQMPAFPSARAQHIPDAFQDLLRRDLLSLPVPQQQRILAILSNASGLMQRQNSQQLLDFYSEALQEFTGWPVPYILALFRLERARLDLQLIESNPRAIAEAGLTDCNMALATLTCTETPVLWAQAHILRGMLYANRQNGVRHDNLKLALADFDVVQNNFTAETLPGAWVMARGMRGMAAQELYKSGEEQYIEQAIADIEAALELLSYEQTPEIWAALKACCTQAYLIRYSYSGDRSRTLEQIIRDCDDALKVATREKLPKEWALLHQTRGIAYIDRSAGDAQQNSKQAITDCNQALTIFVRERDPYDWAATHQYLGNAYLFRVAGDRTRNLQEALKHYDLSLQIFTQEAYPRNWARTLENRNQVTEQLGTGDRPISQEAALDNYLVLLEQFDLLEQPVEWASIHVNWGNSYLNRIEGVRRDNMEQAILHFDQALSVLTPELSPMLWALILINRSMAKRSLLPQNIVNLMMSGKSGPLQAIFSLPLNETMAEVAALKGHNDEAIADLLQALTVLTREKTPREWAQAHRELGNAYGLYMWGNQKEYQAKAQEHFALAESVLSRTSAPREWAVMQMNRGLELLAPTSSGLELNAQAILEHFDAALTIFTAQVAPANYRRVQLVRAVVLERMKRWQEAHQALLRAREVQRDLVAAALSTQSQNVAIAEITFNDMYVHDAQILLRMIPPDPVEAVIALEEGRAQSMRSALDIDNYARRKQHMRDPEVRGRLDAFLEARNTWRARQHLAIDAPPEHLSNLEKHRWQQQQNQALEHSYMEFLRTRSAIRLNDDPDFMSSLPTLDGIAHALEAPDEALVYLTAGFSLPVGLQPISAGRGETDGSEASMVLIVTRRVDGTPEVQSLFLPELTTNAVDMLLQPVHHKASQEEDGTGGESKEYQGVTLKIDLERAIQSLGTIGLNTLAATLSARGIQKIWLLPYGRLGLFPLPAVRIQLPGRPASYLGDLFECAFVPGARAAEIARKNAQAQAKRRPTFLLGGNPQPLAGDADLKDLPFAAAEAETIYGLARRAGYPSSSLYYLAPHEMKKEVIAARMQQVTCAYMALHGSYNIAAPRDSVLILAGTEDMPKEQRTISLGEILDGKIDLHHMRLLVLSACETSVFDIQRLPNEVLGLAAGFLQAGVAGVIASLWPVNEEATYLLITRFASLYLDPQGLWSPAQALAQAQRWLREEATNAVLQEYDPWLSENFALPGEARSSHQKALEKIRQKARRRAQRRPDELLYADPAFWAGFIATGC